jgi:hypothetical protein
MDITDWEIPVTEQDFVAIFTPIAGETSPSSCIEVRRN